MWSINKSVWQKDRLKQMPSGLHLSPFGSHPHFHVCRHPVWFHPNCQYLCLFVWLLSSGSENPLSLLAERTWRAWEFPSPLGGSCWPRTDENGVQTTSVPLCPLIQIPQQPFSARVPHLNHRTQNQINYSVHICSFSQGRYTTDIILGAWERN